MQIIKKRKNTEQEQPSKRLKIKEMPLITKDMFLPRDCQKPKFQKVQRVFEEGGAYFLDSENALIVQHNVLDETELESYLMQAIMRKRVAGSSGFAIKPRYEVCYTTTGEPYNYSGQNHYTKKYPQYILDLIPKFQKIVDDGIGSTSPYKTLSHGVDIVYSNDFDRGGSISRHKDDEMDWGLVIILTLGQSRWLRVRNEEGQFFNIKMKHNSIVCMHGPTFQKKYTHQVDKLSKHEPVHYRMSLNVRFLK